MKSILHLCNFEATDNIESNQYLISSDDAVLFYSMEMSKKQSIKLKELFKDIPVYFVINNNCDNIKTINHQKWLELINTFNTTMTWK